MREPQASLALAKQAEDAAARTNNLIANNCWQTMVNTYRVLAAEKSRPDKSKEHKTLLRGGAMKFEPLRKKSLFLCYANNARDEAAKAVNPELKETWKWVAIHWQTLADVVPDKCFCGRNAIGTKLQEDGSHVPLCNEHLRQALVEEEWFQLRSSPEN